MADAAAEPLSACPRCRAPLVTRTGRNGAWQECSKRPACRFKQDVGHAPVDPRPALPKPLGYRPGCLPLPPGSVAASAIVLDDHQQRAAAWREGLAVVAASAGCHAAGQGILLFSGRVKPVEAVEVGDVLMGPDSTPRMVVCLHRGHGELWRITPTKGDSFVVNENHVLTVALSGRHYGTAWRDVHVSDYLRWSATWRKDAKLVRANAIQFPQEPEVETLDFDVDTAVHVFFPKGRVPSGLTREKVAITHAVLQSLGVTPAQLISGSPVCLRKADMGNFVQFTQKNRDTLRRLFYCWLPTDGSPHDRTTFRCATTILRHIGCDVVIDAASPATAAERRSAGTMQRDYRVKERSVAMSAQRCRYIASVREPPAFRPVDPYFLGILIGDGRFDAVVSVSKPGPVIAAVCAEQATILGLELRHRNDGRCPTYLFVGNRLAHLLRALGLFGRHSGERFVPESYLRAPHEVRAALLAGLIDTDGHMMQGGGVDWISKSAQLAKDFVYLCRSLGLAAYCKACEKYDQNGQGGTYWRVSVSGDFVSLPLRNRRARPRRQRKDVLRTGFTLTPVGPGEYFGFTLTGDGRYLLDDFTVTHNSGKTAVLIDRTCAMLAEGWIPEAICLLAYNRSAADTIRDRLAARVGPAADRVGIHTFHAWAYALLRHWYPHETRLARGRILGTPEAPHPVKLAAPLIDEGKLGISWGAAIDVASRAAEALVDLDAVGASIELARCMGWAPRTGEIAADVAVKADKFHRFCLAWREKKREEGLIEFSDMLGEVAISMRRHPEALAYLGRMYSHVMVDESQDSSTGRIEIARFLGREARSLMFVGDLRQSIYGFSGARPDLFMALAHDPAATLLTLPVNRRSTQRIVEAANAVADGEPWNLGGACVARPGAPVGEVVQTWVQASPSEEAKDVIADIQRRVGAGRGLGTVADPTYCCLARTNAMLVALEHAFVARGVPCRVAGSPGGVWASEVGEQLLHYLEAAEGVPSFGVVKIANQPKRFAKKAEVGEAVEQAREAEQKGQKPMLHARLEAKGGGAGRLGRDLARAAGLSWNRRVLQCARWLGLDEEDDVDGDEDRRACLEALVSLAQQLGSLGGIYDFKTAAARGEKEPAVLLSTIHRMKGGEHPVIYACGVRAGALPHKKCEDKAEEKRLLYVAVTRAKDVLVVSTGGAPSEFLTELGWADEA